MLITSHDFSSRSTGVAYAMWFKLIFADKPCDPNEASYIRPQNISKVGPLELAGPDMSEFEILPYLHDVCSQTVADYLICIDDYTLTYMRTAIQDIEFRLEHVQLEMASAVCCDKD